MSKPNKPGSIYDIKNSSDIFFVKLPDRKPHPYPLLFSKVTEDFYMWGMRKLIQRLNLYNLKTERTESFNITSKSG